MKQLLVSFLFILSGSILQAQEKYSIQPKGYIEPQNNSAKATNHLSAKNKVGGNFRLKEYSAAAQKVIETDIVTFFIAKNNESTVTVNISCAKPIQLHYILADKNNKHSIPFEQEGPEYRLVMELDMSKFKNGVCTLSVYNEKNELIHTIEFEKTSL